MFLLRGSRRRLDQITRSNTRERYFPFPYENSLPKHKSSKASQLRANSGIKNKATECPECQSMNCKQRRFNIKCYDCGVIIEE